MLGHFTRVELLSGNDPLYLTENMLCQLPRQHCICRVDFMGIIKTCESRQQMTDSNGQLISLIPIVVEDISGVNLRVSVWGKIADDWEKHLPKLPGQFISLTSALFKFYK